MEGRRLLARALALALSSIAAAQTTRPISVTPSGHTGNDQSESPTISADGRFIAFTSRAGDIVPGDTNNAYDVFVHDGGTGRVERVSLKTDGSQIALASEANSISADGRYVAFQSSGTDIVPGDTNGDADIFVRDRWLGTTMCASVRPDGIPANDRSAGPGLSADGRFVVFWSYANDILPGDTHGATQVYLRDLLAGVTTLVSADMAGVPGTGFSYEQTISADGRHVAFLGYDPHMVPGDTNGMGDIFVWDRLTGTTERASVSSSGAEADSDCLDPSLSANGRYVVFDAFATTLVPADTNGTSDVFMRDLRLGITTRVSTDAAGIEGNDWSFRGAISGNGRFVAYLSTATNLVAGDVNGYQDIFRRDLLTGAIEILTLSTSGAQSNGHAHGYLPSLSHSGRQIAFDSHATNFAPGDTNGTPDVFRRAFPPTAQPLDRLR